ncbi:hypothetical protein [Eisenibacter elegans]|uniref:hypothetical protein n=1 Tax=Eisenibacter elegans TaxID=997 RepID=UPI0012B5C964|nr:hypothetical protein [Eisenibacter elegans]
MRNAHLMLLEGLLQVGYALVYQERLSIIVLQGIGLGETQVRFRGRLPESLREAARNYTADAYVRSNFGTWRTAIAFEYAFFDIRREKRSSPIISAQIGFQRFFNQSEWAYGERLPSRDNRFFGEPVDLPRFLTRHFFGVLGIHWMFGL